MFIEKGVSHTQATGRPHGHSLTTVGVLVPLIERDVLVHP